MVIQEFNIREFKANLLQNEWDQCVSDHNNYDTVKTTLRELCITLWTALIGVALYFDNVTIKCFGIVIIMSFFFLTIKKDYGQHKNYERLREIEAVLNHFNEVPAEELRSIITPKHHENEIFNRVSISRITLLKIRHISANTAFFYIILILLNFFIIRK